MNGKHLVGASALALGLLLAGCGDVSGGGVASTPAPTASYTKLADMTGDRTFQTAGVQYTSNSAGFVNASTLAFGSGVTVAYTSSSDSYKLTAPDNSMVTFDPSNVVAPNPATPNTQQWLKVNGTIRDQLFLNVPTVNGVALSYTVVGSWAHIANPTTNGALVRLAVGGAPTLASDMPRTGSANYSATTNGSLAQSGTTYTLNGNSSATFSANFASNSVTTSLTLAGTQPPNGTSVTQFGTFNGTGTISSSGPGFAGALNGNGATGAFSGVFFGPKALEMAYSWFLSGGSFNAVGNAFGIKQ